MSVSGMRLTHQIWAQGFCHDEFWATQGQVGFVMQTDLMSIPQQPGKARVVEVVGAAGAGKSTLCQALGEYPNLFRLDNFPDVRRLENAPFYLRNGLKLIPKLQRLDRSGSRQLSRREFAWLTILHGWPALFRQAGNDGAVIILDQGPIYLMAELLLFGPEYLGKDAAEFLWQDLYKQWCDIITMVVWLDAPDEILFDRIRTRQQDHIVKNESLPVVFGFLERYRRQYEVIMAGLASQASRPKVIRFDTGSLSTQAIARQLPVELNF